jgi:hypothetical protein
MKLLVYLLLLASSIANACGFYPYGDQVRVSFLNPDHFNCHSFDGFYYTAHSFYPGNPYRASDVHPNDQIWFDYCHQKVSVDAIKEAVYEIPENHFTTLNPNKMIQYLYQNNDFAAIDYLKFAKSCEIGNMFYADPWERSETIEIKLVQEKLNYAVAKAAEENNEILKLRYQFIAIRLAYYGGKRKDIISIYETINDGQTKNILHDWSMYFRALVEKKKTLQCFYAAQVYANAPDKRFAIFDKFDVNIEIDSVLKHASNHAEKANVFAMFALKKHDKALFYIKKAYQLHPNSEFNLFLFLREINKIEDWVLTPFYTNFNPSISEEDYWNSEQLFSYQKMHTRIEKDRKYAKEFYTFLNTIPKPNLHVEICKAQLLFIAREFAQSLALINSLETKIDKKDLLYNDIQCIKALNLTANQVKNQAIIKEEIKAIILANKDQKTFIFALGRELEYLRNTTAAAFLFSKINDNMESYNGYEMVWKSRKHKRGSYQDYFYDYFGYVDVLYTPEQLESVIKNCNYNDDNTKFDIWLKSRLIAEKSKLYDLLGTKYIRTNNLEKALVNFKKTDEEYWNDYYSLWNINQNGGSYFDKNPFTDFDHTPEFIQPKEDFYLTKITVTEKLIEYLAKANNPIEKKRSYYYFLVANCYKNMTNTGNSWMMRRYAVSAYDVEPFPEDEAEFQNGFLAKKYYKLAYKYGENKKFKSLCLWMAADYKKLKTELEDEYEELSARNCEAFASFFNPQNAKN